MPWLSIAAYLSLAVAMGAAAASSSGGFSCGALGFAPTCPAGVRSRMAFVILWIAAAATVGILMWAASSPTRARHLRIPSQAVMAEGCLLLVVLALLVGSTFFLAGPPAIAGTLYFLYETESLLLLAIAFLDPLFEKGLVEELATTLALANGLLGLLSAALLTASILSPGLRG